MKSENLSSTSIEETQFKKQDLRNYVIEMLDGMDDLAKEGRDEDLHALLALTANSVKLLDRA